MKSLLLAASLLSVATFAHAALNTRTAIVATQVVAIDGTGCAEMISWTGGEPHAAIVLSQGPGLATPQKSLGPIAYEPITIEAAMPFSPALQTVVSEMLSGAQTKRTLLLSSLDGSGQPVGENLQASGALLTEIHFPALDASARIPVRVKLVFQADHTSVTSATASIASAGGTRNSDSTANFSLTLPGLPATGVSKIDAFTIRRASITVTSGSTTRYTPGPLTVPDLTVTIGGADITAWQAWRDSFFPNPSTPSPQTLSAVPYKNGTLQLLSSDLHTPLFTLQLTKLGLKRLAQPPVEASTLLKLRAELFCESMSTWTGNGLAQPATPASPAAFTPQPVPTATPPPATKIIPRELDPAQTLSTKTIASAETSPDDKGARDPAGFPRPPSVTRTSYSSSREPALIREYAYYHAATTKAADLIAFYEKALEASGWKETARSEDNSGPAKTYRITSNWTLEKRTVSLTLGDVAPEKTEIYVSLQERR
ncbi:hypothetical protein CMV30_00815 [Nibricoccus aquaticus]|uniref:SbsA Ig-like domain-containing protein n=1 Tax=Nibricoccus aquaticus TaxID=2576891 RepID=A0A290Q8R6_9BACT|nr:hypothetical protein [Nibricoccus aquaticus]ATC62626.1 hypothetical protein CMV30_00815 [Nibricoccus aquaticus]